MHSDIYRRDLENRFPTYTFRTTKDGDMNTFEALDGLTLICSASRLDLADAIFAVRQTLVGGHEVIPMLTTTQISELSNVCHGTMIFDMTTKDIKIPTVSGMTKASPSWWSRLSKSK